jgi:Kef-type K+ transport system membrane component KefB
MKFWKEHAALRLGLMGLLFLAGLALIIGGWKETGKLSGVLAMLAGVALLLAALFLYNRPFEEPKTKKSK